MHVDEDTRIVVWLKGEFIFEKLRIKLFDEDILLNEKPKAGDSDILNKFAFPDMVAFQICRLKPQDFTTIQLLLRILGNEIQTSGVREIRPLN